ncbi:hypothetical protein [Polaribacter sp. Hel_I_88]|uniref:hypothetical protein n=1 Tax=Polaribacter sp. Hel_I_88 TaxID=1250006 RepID=UPI00047BE85C|nr:hypothetical protein [Polaribacter sp. Hel_I_88]
MQDQKNILVSNMSKELKSLVDQLNKIKPDKNFHLTIYEPNMFWKINWKTDRYLEECFRVQIYADDAKYSLIAEHGVKDFFEHINDRYFNFKEKTLEEFYLITNEIVQKIKKAVLVSIDKDLDKGM